MRIITRPTIVRARSLTRRRFLRSTAATVAAGAIGSLAKPAIS
ncbi:MAG: twin-arginine translocation signal domain-containing protein, partial [Xanthobacteraceae bacterium]|nr:twin-arginine translocation signal domain-containing protein [Xanthobacteraceae bacterium]